MEIKLIKDYELSEVPAVAQLINSFILECKIVLFIGELGAGKTTMVKELLKLQGVKEEVTSPTYTIVNEYESEGGSIVYHMDLYRLESLEEAEEIGMEDMLDSGNLCLIEWPEIIAPLLLEGYLEVKISHLNASKRHLEISKYS